MRSLIASAVVDRRASHTHRAVGDRQRHGLANWSGQLSPSWFKFTVSGFGSTNLDKRFLHKILNFTKTLKRLLIFETTFESLRRHARGGRCACGGYMGRASRL